MIKNLVFDLGGVILEDHFANAAKPIAEKFNIDEQELIDVYHEHNGLEYQNGSLSHEQRWQSILQKLNRTDIDLQEVLDIHRSIFVPIPGMIEMVEKLKDVFPLYMLSNQVDAILPTLEAKYTFFKAFKYSVFSHKVGLGKPNEDIFEYLIEKTGIIPKQSLFIDNQEDNIATANKLGFPTLLFKNAEQFTTELKNLNLWQ